MTLFTELGQETESKYVYSTERLTWDEADRACKAAGMQLATIRNEEEQMQVRRRLLPHTLSVASNFVEPLRKHDYMLMSNAWIGLRAEAGGDFEWLDASARADASDDKYGWGVFQPNESRRQPRCGMMIRGMWNDRKCDVKSGYVCEQAAVCDVVECDSRFEAEQANVTLGDASRFCPAAESLVDANGPHPHAAPDAIVDADVATAASSIASAQTSPAPRSSPAAPLSRSDRRSRDVDAVLADLRRLLMRGSSSDDA